MGKQAKGILETKAPLALTRPVRTARMCGTSLRGRGIKADMAKDSDIAENLIPARLKRSASYHSDYGKKTFGEIKKLAAKKPPDKKAQQMKKLIVEKKRLLQKLKGQNT